MDYDAEGKLIVDGAKMANDTFKGVGYCTAFLIGWVLERRFIGFSTEVSLPQKLTRAVIGLLGYYAVSLILAFLVKAWIPGPAGTTIFLLSSIVLRRISLSALYIAYRTDARRRLILLSCRAGTAWQFVSLDSLTRNARSF